MESIEKQTKLTSQSLPSRAPTTSSPLPDPVNIHSSGSWHVYPSAQVYSNHGSNHSGSNTKLPVLLSFVRGSNLRIGKCIPLTHKRYATISFAWRLIMWKFNRHQGVVDIKLLTWREKFIAGETQIRYCISSWRDIWITEWQLQLVLAVRVWLKWKAYKYQF